MRWGDGLVYVYLCVVCLHTPPNPKRPTPTTTNNTQVGGVVGFALGGPLLALVGAAWTSYSCTQPSSDAGEAARGTGQWAVGFYNFFAKVGRWVVGGRVG